MNEQGTKLNLKELAESSRDFTSMNELVGYMRRMQKVWSWGAHNYANYSNKILKFNVQAHRHTGHIYLRVNGADLFDIYLTTSHKTIKKIITDVYLDQLINVIDEDIEMVDEYKN